MSDTEEPDDEAVEVFEPTVTVKISQSVDAVYALGEGRSIKVKTSASGIRLSYTKRIKNNYYGQTESRTEGVTFPIQFLPLLTELLNKVAD